MPLGWLASADSVTVPFTFEPSAGVSVTVGSEAPAESSTALSALTSGSAIPSGSPPHCTPDPHPGAAELPSGSSPVRSRSDSICAGVMDWFAARTRAATPATCGAAMLVPLMLWYVPPVHVEYTATPGAVTSILGP